MINSGARADHGLRALIWLTFGIITAGMFATAQLPPLRVTIIVLAISSIVAIVSLRTTELSILSRLFVLLFSLPFAATLGYLVDIEYVWWQTRGNVRLCQNHPLINEMLVMVLVGLCGLMLGLEYGVLRRRRVVRPLPQANAPSNNRTLPLPAVWMLLLAAFALSWLHAPEKSILEVSYMSSDSGHGKDGEAGMNASCLVSYLILILLFVDAERETLGSKRQWHKLILTSLVSGYIIVVLQLLSGDRECAGLVAALVALYITSPSTLSSRERIRQTIVRMNRVYKLLLPLAGCVAVFLALGAVRHTASQSSAEKQTVWQMVVDGATQNTWTAVALNNLGVAADYNYGTIEYLYGQTYLDYFLSLPPGIVTKTLGYERPIEGDGNPSNWYLGEITAGGMHPVVVPFKNLGIFCVLVVLFLCGLFICSCELANETGTLYGRLIYGSLATGSMMWFWYGDMSLIRTMMCCGMLYVLHKFVATSRPVFGISRRPVPALAAMS